MDFSQSPNDLVHLILEWNNESFSAVDGSEQTFDKRKAS